MIMKKFKMLLTGMCLVALLALAFPTVTFAEESGPQGGTRSTTTPPPPPPDLVALLRAIIGSGVF